MSSPLPLLHSYLGYGLMAGRAKVMDALQATQGAHPCFSKVRGQWSCNHGLASHEATWEGSNFTCRHFANGNFTHS
jgi:hypothetical protein